MIKSRRVRWAGHVVSMIEDVYTILMVQSEGKSPLRRSRWNDNIEMDIREIGWGCMGRIHLVQDRDKEWALVNTVMNLQVS
jgi:hypothetical protein